MPKLKRFYYRLYRHKPRDRQLWRPALFLLSLVCLLSTIAHAQGDSPFASPDAVLWEKALALKEDGHYRQAAVLFRLLAEVSRTRAPDALFHLGDCLEREGDWAQAALTWQEFLNRFPDDQRASGALFRLGRAWEQMGKPQAAIYAYTRYARSEAPLADLAWEKTGDLYKQQGDYEGALSAYEKALKLAADAGRLKEKMAQAYVEAGELNQAIALYEEMLASATSPYQQARTDYLLGQVLLQMGRYREAYARFRDAVKKAPDAEYAYFSLIELVEAGVSVDEFLRGLVDYYACSSYPAACGAAVLAFQRYIQAHPRDHKAEAHHYSALCYRTAGSYELALREWDVLIETHPKSPLVPESQWQKARTLEMMGDLEGALAAYKLLRVRHPQSPYALKALWRIAALLEKTHRFREASQTYEKIAEEEQDQSRRAEAFFKAGLALYRESLFQEAAEKWEKLLEENPDSPRALFWLGKAAYARGEPYIARRYWRRVASLAPSGYYGLRARVRLRSFEVATCAPFSPPQLPDDPARQLTQWVEVWAPSGSTCEPSPEGWPCEDPRFRRAEAFLEAGLEREAIALYEAIRRDYSRDPLALARLSTYLRDKGLYAPSIRSALTLIALAEETGAPPPPFVLMALAYPLYYDQLIYREACAAGMDPLFLAAIIHQESLFDAGVSSWAGAMGLMQIIPSTGQGIARALGWDGYETQDLLRPFLSVKFGLWYLARQREHFGDWVAALAAYNAGPVNAAGWWEEAQGDPELFVELMSLDEPRVYVKRIYEKYAAYLNLYRPPQQGRGVNSGFSLWRRPRR